MKVGILQIFQNYEGQRNDADVVDGELRLGILAEEIGFDKVWAVEHHFTDYAACPDNFTYLSCLAGQTQRVRLGTGAVIVPWNDPLRVAEKVSLLGRAHAKPGPGSGSAGAASFLGAPTTGAADDGEG